VKRGRKFQRINVVAAQFESTDGEINLIAPFCYIENTTGDLFESWFRTKLVKSVSKGSTIIMDNASFHRKKKLKNLARRHSVKLLFLPAYSPDLNPIENTWANMKRALPDILSGSENIQHGIYHYLSG
jgi:transposase